MLLLPPIGTALELRAAPLSESLPIIGRALGVTMRAAPSIGEEIVIARLDGATLDATKAHLVDAFSAEWRVDLDGTLVLAPSKARRESDRREWIEARRRRFAAGLRALEEERKRLVRFDPVALDHEVQARPWKHATDEDPTPLRRLLLTLVEEIDPKAIIGDDPSPRIVFSLKPTDAQRALGPRGEAAFREYAETYERWSAVRTEEVWNPSERPPGLPARVLLVVQPEATRTFEIAVFDESGAPIEYGEAPLAEEVGAGDARERFPYDVSVELPNPLILHHYDVTKGEPLAGIVSSIVLDGVRRAGLSTVIAADDDMARMFHRRSGDLREWLWDSSRLERDAPGWITIAMNDPYVTRATFFPRGRLRRARALIVAGDAAPIEARLAYTRMAPAWPEMVHGAAFPLYEAQSIPVPSFDDYLVGSLLTSAEWGAAERRPIALGALHPAAAKTARKAYYQAGPLRGHNSPSPWIAARWNDEPTNHPFRSLRLRLETSEVTLARMIRKSAESRLIAASEIRAFVRMFADPRGAAWLASEFELDRTTYVSRREWTLTVDAPGGRELTSTMEDRTIPLDPRPYRLDRIPEWILARIDANP